MSSEITYIYLHIVSQELKGAKQSQLVGKIQTKKWESRGDSACKEHLKEEAGNDPKIDQEKDSNQSEIDAHTQRKQYNGVSKNTLETRNKQLEYHNKRLQEELTAIRNEVGFLISLFRTQNLDLLNSQLEKLVIFLKLIFMTLQGSMDLKHEISKRGTYLDKKS